MVLWTKTPSTYTDPFDGSTVTVLEVNNIRISIAGVETKLPNEHYTFADGTLDATIQSDIDVDLAAKGYAIN